MECFYPFPGSQITILVITAIVKPGQEAVPGNMCYLRPTHLYRQLEVPCQPWGPQAVTISICVHITILTVPETPQRGWTGGGVHGAGRKRPPVPAAWKSRNPRFCQAPVWHATGESPYENQAPQANCQFQSSKP